MHNNKAMKSTKELLQFKRDGGAWSDVEMRWFIDGVVCNVVSKPQVAAFLMAACINGLNAQEVASLTLAMAESGEHLSRGNAKRPRIDKHSTGGVGDKVSLLLAPLAVSCGLSVPMISGRGLGHTGGTVDKLESVPGLRMTYSMEELEVFLSEHHFFMAAQSENLAPADRILYGVRDVTGTVENVGLITASILSKKFAEELDGLAMDVKVGAGAFMKTLAQAEELASSLQSVAKIAGLPFRVLFTRMDDPLGRSVGNWVEVSETEEALKDMSRCSPDLFTITFELAVRMVLLGKPSLTEEEAGLLVKTAWEDGTAHLEFMRMLERQGGDFTEGQRQFEESARTEVRASKDGIVQEIQSLPVALAVMTAGGGRLKETDVIDPLAGVEFVVQRGSTVKCGDVLAVVSASSKGKLSDFGESVKRSVVIEKTPPENLEASLIIQRW